MTERSSTWSSTRTLPRLVAGCEKGGRVSDAWYISFIVLQIIINEIWISHIVDEVLATVDAGLKLGLLLSHPWPAAQSQVSTVCFATSSRFSNNKPITIASCHLIGVYPHTDAKAILLLCFGKSGKLRYVEHYFALMAEEQSKYIQKIIRPLSCR